MTQQGLTEDFYQHVGRAHGVVPFTEEERLAIEYAERFAVDHTSIDDEFFARLRTQFTDAEIFDLTVCLAHFLGLGRLLRVLGIDETRVLDVGVAATEEGADNPGGAGGAGGPDPPPATGSKPDEHHGVQDRGQ